MSKTITTKYFGQTDRLITARAKLALLIDITDHRINLLYDTVSSPQHSMHTGAKSIDRFINRVTLVRSTFVVRVERERGRGRGRGRVQRSEVGPGRSRLTRLIPLGGLAMLGAWSSTSFVTTAESTGA